MMTQTDQFKKASIRLSFEVTQLRLFARKNNITYLDIQEKTGLGNISRFMNNKMQTPSFMTFLLISEAIGFEINIKEK